MRRSEVYLVAACLIIPASCAVVFLPRALAVQATGINYDPDPVPVGNWHHLWVTYNNNPGVPVVWEWHKRWKDAAGDWHDVVLEASSDNIQALWYLPGKRQARVWVGYDRDDPSLSPDWVDFDTPDIVVAPPDTETITGDFGVPIPLDVAGQVSHYAVLTTVWTYDQQAIAMDASTTAEEKRVDFDRFGNQVASYGWAAGSGGTWDFTINRFQGLRSSPG